MSCICMNYCTLSLQEVDEAWYSGSQDLGWDDLTECHHVLNGISLKDWKLIHWMESNQDKKNVRITEIMKIVKQALYLILKKTPKNKTKQRGTKPASYVELCFEVWDIFLYSTMLLFYKVMRRNLPTIRPGTVGRTSSLNEKCTGFFNVHYTTHRTYSFTSHLKDTAVMVKCLA